MIFDLHNDLPTSEMSEWQQCDVVRNTNDTVIYAFWTTEMSVPFAYIRRGIRVLPCKAFGVEDIGFASDADLEDLCALQPAYCGLTHNRANRFAGGALEDGALTAAGERAIRLMNRAGIVLDTAHLSRSCFFRATDLAERVIDSHTGWETVCSHPRNLTDEQVRRVREKDGLVGLTAVADFIGGDTVSDYVRLIDGFVQAYGIDGVSIGTDFYGTKPLRGLQNYRDFDGVTYALQNRGYTSTDIGKIFYDNAKQYFKYRRY